MGAAVSTGVAVAGGLLGLTQKQAEAKRQKEMISKQEAAQRMQADLQLFGLLQQRAIDGVNDLVTDAAQKQTWLQTQTSLSAQELSQQLANAQANFAADVQKKSTDVDSKQKQMKADTEFSNARIQAGNQALEALVGASTEEQQLISSVLKQLQTSGSNRNSISLLLDYAAANGGVNEALEMLTKEDTEATDAANAVGRATQVKDAKVDYAKLAADANVDLASLQRLLANANTEIERQSNYYSADASATEANTAYEIGKLGIASARAANDANLGIMSSTNAIQRNTRYLNSLANEKALKQGTAINSEILALQKSNVSSPGFFDYVNLGVQGYGMYNQLKKGA